MRKVAIAGVLLTLLTATLAADNWPQWRGPLATGVSPERQLPERWSDTENIAWKAAIGGLGVSSPVVWGDRVFVTSQAGSGVVRPGPRLVQSGDPLQAGERPLTTATGEGLLPLPFPCLPARSAPSDFCQRGWPAKS